MHHRGVRPLFEHARVRRPKPERGGRRVCHAARKAGRRNTWAGDGLNWTRLVSLDDTLGNCFFIAYASVTRQLVTLAFSGGKSAPAIGHTLVLGQAGWMRSQAVTPVVTQALIVDDPAA